MIRLSLAIAATLALASPALAAPPDRASDEAELRRMKLELWPGFYRRQDADGLAAFLSDDFVAQQPDGVLERKADAVAWVRANPWTNAQRDFRYRIDAVAFYSDDLANIYGVGSFADADCAGGRRAYSSANLFRREAGGWRALFSHTSATACAAPPA